jgi:hypothetical protein
MAVVEERERLAGYLRLKVPAGTQPGRRFRHAADRVRRPDNGRGNGTADGLAERDERGLSPQDFGVLTGERHAGGHDRPGNRRPGHRHRLADARHPAAEVADLRVDDPQGVQQLRRICPDLDVDLTAADC